MNDEELYRCKNCGQLCDVDGGGEFPTPVTHVLGMHVNIDEYMEPVDPNEVESP